MMYFLLSLVIAGPVIASLAVCAPKTPLAKSIGNMLKKLDENLEARERRGGNFFTRERWYLYPVRWLWAVPVFVAVAAVVAVVAWVQLWAALVERACPYTPATVRKERDEWAKLSYAGIMTDVLNGLFR